MESITAGNNPRDVWSRLVRGIGATSVGVLITMLIQIMRVPIFLHSWGPRLYGEWLLLSSVPTYLAMSDFGFGSVAGNDMTMRVAAGDRRGALITFQSTWVLLTVSSLCVGLLLASLCVLLPVAPMLHIHILPKRPMYLVLALLSVYSILSLQGQVISSGFRCDGGYAHGMLLGQGVRLTENLALAIVVLAQGGVVTAAIALTGCRLIGTVMSAFVLARRSPWIEFGVSYVSMSRAKVLLGPAIAFTAFPLGTALSIEGMLLMIGTTLGPIAVASFQTMRTLSRLAFQLMESIKNGTWPELSAAYGSGNWPLARSLHRRAVQMSVWLCIVATGGLAVLGPSIIHLWTHGQLEYDPVTFHVLLCVVLVNTCWNTSSVACVAANRHQRVAALYALGTALSLVAAYILMQRLGLRGAALGLLGVDVCMSGYVLRHSLTLLGDSPTPFFASLFNFGGLARCWGTRS